MYTPNKPEPIVAPDLLLAYNLIFGPEFSTTGRLTYPNGASGQLIYQYAIALHQLPLSVMAGVLAEIMTGPLILFHENRPYSKSLVNNTSLAPKVGVTDDSLKISIDLSESRIVAVLPKWVVIVYFVISLTLYSCCISALFLSFRVQGPRTSKFEIIDFSSKILSGNGKLSSFSYF